MGRELQIVPSSKGALNITIIDEDLPTAPPTVTTLAISGIS